MCIWEGMPELIRFHVKPFCCCQSDIVHSTSMTSLRKQHNIRITWSLKLCNHYGNCILSAGMYIVMLTTCHMSKHGSLILLYN